ncbi:MAG TPA: FHA domain-containing protein [Ktedonosporobacter sp.]|nr:FHA domain-containing protein [Ktedonosporobacter sp.]
MQAENASSCVSTIKFLVGPLAGKTILIHKAITTIGRDPGNDIVIFGPNVAQRHAWLRWEQGCWSIEKFSENDTLIVNQQNIQRALLQQNSIIRLGDTITFLFQAHVKASTALQPALKTVRMARTMGVVGMSPPPLAHPPQSSPLPQISGPLPNSPVSASGNLLRSPLGLRERTAIGGVPWLEVSSTTSAEKRTHRFTRPVINIGRNPVNDIVINESVISGVHAQIVFEGGQWFFTHPHPERGQTLNGLLYQGRSFRGNEHFRKPLTHGDIFRIGDEHGTLVTLSFNDDSGSTTEILPEIHPIPLSTPMLSIGRVDDNMVILEHPLVSAYHARVEQGPGGYRIIDLNSTNHVYVNAQLVTNHLLRIGDEIRIGPFRFTYTGTELTQYDERSSIRIDALDLKKVSQNGTMLLNTVSLVIPPRKFVAVVGSSGAGKSMLLDALNGLRPAQQGVVLYNGQNYYRNLMAFCTQLGYVPQDDIVHSDLVVEHALYYAAKMRLPADFTQAQIEQRIDEVLGDVEMREQRKMLVSKLSGGQRKRISIAMELLAKPGIFFLDEPTSGLDPGLDRKMMLLLRRLADRGCTVILVTHATTNINVCDYICFLAQGGRLAYFGPPNEARTFFQKHDFAEIYSVLEPTKDQPQIAQEAEARFKASSDYEQYVLGPMHDGVMGHFNGPTTRSVSKHSRRGHPLSQFLLLFRRYVELLSHDKGNLFVLLLQAPIIALILVVMLHYEIGGDIFHADKLVQCRTQISVAGTRVVARPTGMTSGPRKGGDPTSSGGNPLQGIATLTLPDAKGSDLVACDRVVDFLRKDPAGGSYARKRGGVSQALQDFIIAGPGADAQRVLFMMVFATVLFGCINGAREIVKEAPIYRRERAINLGILPYLFSKIAVLGLLCLLQSAVLVLIVDIGVPLEQGVFLPIFLEVYITLLLTSLAGLMLGLAVSALAPNNDWAISFVPLVLVPQVIFSGTTTPFKDWLTQILALAFPTRWAMVALGTSLGLHSDKIGGDKLLGDDAAYHGTLFSTFSQADATQRIVLAWVALGMIILVLATLTGVFLKRKDVRA